MTAFKRALIASGALFAVVFALLAGQLWFGNDPALGEGAARVSTQKPEQELHASVLDTVLGVATGLLDDEHGDDDGEGSSSVRSGTS
jgi:hypothetical protein